MTLLTRLRRLPEDWGTALAVVAHPDDLEYGVTSAIARWTAQGKQIAYLVATRGASGIDSIPPEQAGPIREAEQRKSAAIVGVHVVEFLDHSDGLIEYGPALRRDIARAIRKHRPEVLITNNYHMSIRKGALNMPDHRSVGLACLDASRDAGNRWVFQELCQEGLEPWAGVKMILISESPKSTHAVDVTDYIERGIASLQEHQVYIANLAQSFDPNGFLRRNAKMAGKRLGSDYAVSFEVTAP